LVNYRKDLPDVQLLVNLADASQVRSR